MIAKYNNSKKGKKILILCFNPFDDEILNDEELEGGYLSACLEYYIPRLGEEEEEEEEEAAAAGPDG